MHLYTMIWTAIGLFLVSAAALLVGDVRMFWTGRCARAIGAALVGILGILGVVCLAFAWWRQS